MGSRLILELQLDTYVQDTDIDYPYDSIETLKKYLKEVWIIQATGRFLITVWLTSEMMMNLQTTLIVASEVQTPLLITIKFYVAPIFICVMAVLDTGIC